MQVIDKPYLACDATQESVKFPCILMPKIDGVRGINLAGSVTGRSLKPFRNPVVTRMFSGNATLGFDGELVRGSITSNNLCKETTGMLNKATSDTPDSCVYWYVFDYAVDGVYVDRLKALQIAVAALGSENVKVVPWEFAYSWAEVQAYEKKCVAEGYEGVILRDPYSPYKPGRCTPKEAAFMRIKRFVDFECRLLSILPAEKNNNPSKNNPLGYTERTSHKAGKTPKKEVGAIVAEVLQDVFDSRGNLVVRSGAVVKIGPGKMTKKERQDVWNCKDDHKGRVVKAKMFPFGIKDKPRFPTFLSFRADEDM